MNKVILSGRLTADPSKRTTPNGKDTVSFSIACNRNYKNQNGEYDADFINCIAWGGTAVFISNYFKKGSGIHAIGSIQTRSYEDKNGAKRYATEVNVTEVEFCGVANKGEAKKAPKPLDPEDIFEPVLDIDDIF